MPMRSLLLKLFALLAYIAMPFTMSVAMSAPTPASSHHEAGMAMDGMEGMTHCPHQPPAGIDHTAFIGCAMMCAALPGSETAKSERRLFIAGRPTPSPVRPYSGVSLEIATPPPRTA